MREYLVHQYVCQMLNLFEMALRFRKEGIVAADIFGSWVIWMWSLCEAKVFQGLWDKNKLGINYIPDFARIMEGGIRISRAAATARPKRDGMREFFEFVAKELGDCQEVMNWLSRNDGQPSARRALIAARPSQDR